MKLIVKKSSLEVCVKNLVRVINPKNALPILGDILFDVNEQEKTARLTASDSEITLNYTVMLDECEGGGRFCVGAETLAAMLSEVSEQPLTIIATTESDMKFTLSYENGKAYSPIENADEYPTPVQPNADTLLVTVDCAMLKRTIKRSLWATANDDLRPVMNGIEFNFECDNCDVVASDGHAFIKNAETVDHVNESGSFIMPKKVAKILPDLLGEGDIDLMFDERLCTIEQDGMALQFRCIEGKYPNYNSIIPKEHKHEVRCDRAALLSALRAVSPFTPESSNMVTLTFCPNNRLEVTGDNFDFAIGAEKAIYIDGYEGETMSIGIKASNIITLLTKLMFMEVTMKFNDPSRAVIIEAVDESDDPQERITGLTMPMLIND